MSTNAEPITIADEINELAGQYAGSDEEFLIDMLTDLMLFAVTTRVDFANCLRIAHGHFNTELSERRGKVGEFTKEIK